MSVCGDNTTLELASSSFCICLPVDIRYIPSLLLTQVPISEEGGRALTTALYIGRYLLAHILLMIGAELKGWRAPSSSYVSIGPSIRLLMEACNTITLLETLAGFGRIEDCTWKLQYPSQSFCIPTICGALVRLAHCLVEPIVYLFVPNATRDPL